MISKEVASMLNDQITEEFYAAFLYLSMAAEAEDMNLKGLANWMYVQHQEEHTHAMRIFHYLVEQDVKVILKDISAPKSTWKSPVEIAKDALNHEQKVTAMFNRIMDKAVSEKDYASIAFIQWYISEQVEEEASAKELIAKYEMAGEDKTVLFMIDSGLLSRTFTPAFAVKATPVQLKD